MGGLRARWIFFAFAMHGVAVALLLIAVPRRAQFRSSDAPRPASVPFDFEVLEVAAVRTRPDTRLQSIGDAKTAHVAGARAKEIAAGKAPADLSRDSNAAEVSLAPGIERRPGLPALDLSRESLGLDPRSVLLAGLERAGERAASAPVPEHNEAPGVGQSVRDALAEHDRALGLGAAGPIVAIAEEVARASSTPWNSNATIKVLVDATGAVAAVRLVRVSEAWGDWGRVASDLREALRRLTLRVPKGSSGVEATIEVTSRFQLPSGHDPVTEVSVLGVPLKRAPPTAKQPMRVELLKPQLSIADVAPPPDSNAPIKLPEKQLVIGITLLGLEIDPTDLAPRPLRVVHARVTAEHVL
ncbi:MAG: hypothetical protein WBY94_11395 [Polyangiaceae bacterium]